MVNKTCKSHLLLLQYMVNL